MSPAVRIKDSHLEQRDFLRRMAWAGVLILLSAGVLGARLTLLQIARHEHYLELSQGNRARIEPIPANIYTHKTLSGSFSVRNPALAELGQDVSIDCVLGLAY